MNEYKEQPLYILDDKEINKKELELLDEQTINSVSIIKGDLAKNKYGERGENGAIIIKSRTDNSRNNPYVKIIKAKLYIVDGEEIKEADFYKIDPENIKSINVLKGESAIKKYGDKGQSGVIEMLTKNGKWETRFIIGKSFRNDSTNVQSINTHTGTLITQPMNDSIYFNNTKVIGNSTINGKTPIYIVDDKEVKKEDFYKTNHKNITSMTVLTDKNATDKYGNKGKNGVIQITTKQ